MLNHKLKILYSRQLEMMVLDSVIEDLLQPMVSNRYSKVISGIKIFQSFFGQLKRQELISKI